MAYRLKRLPLAVLQLVAAGALTTIAASPAVAQQASSADTQQPIRVDVTGSNIKRSDKESADNIQVLTAKAIEESGKTTVADFLRTLSSNVGAFTEVFTNSFSPGAAAAGLRGLSAKYTLVLLNGQRITNYGFAQNLQDTYVDLNSIPTNAVDHIDVLKDGASSVYGSDAVAGVINIVLKKDYKGTEVDVQYGDATTGNTLGTAQSSITTGFGNLQDDGYNVMIAASVFHRDDMLESQRSLTAGQDTRGYPGGSFNWPITNAYMSDANPLAPQSAFPTCGTNGLPGQVVNFNPLGYNQTNNPPPNGINGFTYPGQLYGTACALNSTNSVSLIPGTERANVVVNGSLKINSTTTAFGDFFIAAVKTKAQMGLPQQLGPGSVATNPAGGISQISNTLPVGNPSNPTNAPQDIIYTFQSIGNPYYQVNSYTSRLSGGLKGSLNADWDWEVVAGVSENNVGQTNFNMVSVPALTSAIANGTYNFLNPGLTPAASNSLRTQFEQASVAKLATLGAKISGPLFSLPAGEAQGAIGYEFHHESEDNQPDTRLMAGDILGYGSTLVDGSRNVNALYGEIELPLLKTLTGNVALREEKYSDLGSNLSPKVSLRYQPFDILTLRGTYSLGYRAPSIPEISHASSTFFTDVYDPVDPQQRPQESTAGVVQANPHLKAERSDNVDLGFVLAPTKDLSFTVDYYRISVNNVVAQEPFQGILDNPSAFPGQIVRNAGGTLVYISSLYTNSNRIYTRGEDFDGSYVFHLSPGSKLTTDLNFSFIDRWDYSSPYNANGQFQSWAGTDGQYQFANGGAAPRLRGFLSEAWDTHDWTIRGTSNFTSGYKELGCINYGECTSGPIGSNQANENTLASYVHSFTTFDAYVEYRGFKNWTLSASVTDLFNKMPPFDAANSPVDSTLYDLTGRFINFRAAYKF